MTKKQRMLEFYRRFDGIGIAYDDVEALRRIEMTLHRWSENECNGDIERDEVTQKTYRTYGHNGPGPVRRYPTADKEKGALKRLDAIMARYPQFKAYYQGDPRGCSLYLVPVKDLEGGKDIDAYYSRGYAVCY